MATNLQPHARPLQRGDARTSRFESRRRVMSTSEGYVIGTTKLVDHGPDSARWNLVILGDGYQASELA